MCQGARVCGSGAKVVQTTQNGKRFKRRASLYTDRVTTAALPPKRKRESQEHCATHRAQVGLPSLEGKKKTGEGRQKTFLKTLPLSRSGTSPTVEAPSSSGPPHQKRMPLTPGE